MTDNPSLSEQTTNIVIDVDIGLWNPIKKTVWPFTCNKLCVETFGGLDEDGNTRNYPERCKDCNNKKNQYVRMKEMKTKIKERYDITKHTAVGFLTVSLPGGNFDGLRQCPPKIAVERIIEARKQLYSMWNKFWRNWGRKNFAGAIRFFEWTEAPHLLQEHLPDDMPNSEVVRKIHPHLHIMLIQDKHLDIKTIRTKLLNAGFGNQIDMQWRKKCTTFKSIDYCLSYTKKDLQIDGRNRQTYGCLYGSVD